MLPKLHTSSLLELCEYGVKELPFAAICCEDLQKHSYGGLIHRRRLYDLIQWGSLIDLC